MSNTGTKLDSISHLMMPPSAVAGTFPSTPPSASPSISPASGSGPFSHPRPPAHPKPKSRLQRAQTEGDLLPSRPSSRAAHDSAPSSPGVSSSTAPASPSIQHRSILSAAHPAASLSSPAYSSAAVPCSNPFSESGSSSLSSLQCNELTPHSNLYAGATGGTYSQGSSAAAAPEVVYYQPTIMGEGLRDIEIMNALVKVNEDPKLVYNIDFSKSALSENGIYTYRLSQHIKELRQLTIRTKSPLMNTAISHLLPEAPKLNTVKIIYDNQDPSLLNALTADFENRKYAPTFKSLEIVCAKNFPNSPASELSKNALIAATSKIPGFQIKFS